MHLHLYDQLRKLSITFPICRLYIERLLTGTTVGSFIEVPLWDVVRARTMTDTPVRALPLWPCCKMCLAWVVQRQHISQIVIVSPNCPTKSDLSESETY